MNLGTIRGRARVYLSQTDPNNSNFTDAQLNGFAYDWLKDMATWSKWAKDETTISGGTVVGQRQYTVDPAVVLQIKEVYVNSFPVDLVTEEFIKSINRGWRGAGNSSPRYAWMYDTNKLALYPTPDTAAQEILIRYIAVPADFTDDTTNPDLPEPYHQLGALYIASMAELSREKLERHAVLLKDYSDFRESIRQQSVQQIKQEGWEWSEERSNSTVKYPLAFE